MIFNRHSDLDNKHAFLSPSNYSWHNWSEETMAYHFDNKDAAARGTADHAFAAECIKRKQKLWRSKQTLAMYVNDAIGFDMEPEVTLYANEFWFGHADAICFNEHERFLRIHDLKTGLTPAKIDQLLDYEALFCIEYGIDPREIQSELRIYQCNDILIYVPDPVNDILPVIKKGQRFSAMAAKRSKEGDWSWMME